MTDRIEKQPQPAAAACCDSVLLQRAVAKKPSPNAAGKRPRPPFVVAEAGARSEAPLHPASSTFNRRRVIC